MSRYPYTIANDYIRGLRMLMSFGNSDGSKIFPSISRIAALRNKSSRAIKGNIASLTKKGWLKSKRQHNAPSYRFVTIPETVKERVEKAFGLVGAKNSTNEKRLGRKDSPSQCEELHHVSAGISTIPTSNNLPSKPTEEGNMNHDSHENEQAKNAASPIRSVDDNRRLLGAHLDIKMACTHLTDPKHPENKAKIAQKWPNGISPEVQDFARRIQANEIAFETAVFELADKRKAAST